MLTGTIHTPLLIRISLSYRSKRMKMFEEFYRNEILETTLPPQDKITILDLGGTFSYWQSMDFKYADSAEFILLNLEKPKIPDGHENFTGVAGNATNLGGYGDKQFDLVFSNSVIEHVGDFEAQKRMAFEMRRVGKHCYLQTPNKFFFMEPHYLRPFVQFLPVRLRAFLVRRFKMGNMPKAINDEEAMQIAQSIRLMAIGELKELFPTAKIQREKFLFMTKSFTLWE